MDISFHDLQSIGPDTEIPSRLSPPEQFVWIHPSYHSGGAGPIASARPFTVNQNGRGIHRHELIVRLSGLYGFGGNSNGQQPQGEALAARQGNVGSRGPWPLLSEIAIREHTVSGKIAVAVSDVDHVADTLCLVSIGLLPESTGPFGPAREKLNGSIGLCGVVVRHGWLSLQRTGMFE